jgi:hypothetical protein
MTDDAAALQVLWMSGREDAGDMHGTIARVLDQDRAERAREQRIGGAGAIVMLALVPVLIWASVYGISPLVRAAYALMGAGCVAGVVAQWLYLSWSRQALPGPMDTRSQLQMTAFVLDCHLRLARTAVLWSSPVFIGGMLICVWLYRERTLTAALTVCSLNTTAWIVSGIAASRGAASLSERRRQVDDALASLQADGGVPLGSE